MEAILSGKIQDLRSPRFYDVVILSIVFILVGLSVVMVYSTTGVISSEKFSDPLFYLKRQVTSVVLGFVILFLCARINIERLKTFSPFCLPICLLLLFMTLLPGVGESSGGAKRWVNLFIIRFQPGEIVKVLFAVFIAGYLGRHENKLHFFTDGVLKPFTMVALVCGLLLIQPDFGSASVIAIISFAMIAATGVRLRYMALCGIALLMSAVTLVLVSPYRMRRIISFLNPWADPAGKGYQLIQSLIAVGTGQVSGVGLGASQQKLFFLPAAHTDFIYAVIGEELGFVGCVAVLLLFVLFLWRGLTIAAKLSDRPFSFALAIGLTLLVVAPALLNVGVVTGMLPTKGLVLPLVGYGGTSLVACMAAIGLLLALNRSIHDRVDRS